VSDYTIVDLKQVEDMAPKFGLAPGLESRFARAALESEQSGLTYFRLSPGYRIPFGHRHAEQEETYVVVSGGARVKLGDAIQELGPWQAVRIAPATMRGLEAGPDGAEVLAFGAGPARDAETDPGWWPADDVEP
jgi:quercetin dioxygenase-like cupin family protein